MNGPIERNKVSGSEERDGGSYTQGIECLRGGGENGLVWITVILVLYTRSLKKVKRLVFIDK